MTDRKSHPRRCLMRACLLTVAWLLPAGAWAGSSSRPASRPASGPAPAPPLKLPIQLHRPEPTGPYHLLARQELQLRLTADVAVLSRWALAYQTETLQNGMVRVDTDTVARLSLTAPDVRVRTALTLDFRLTAKRMARRDLVVLPAGMLESSAAGLRDLDVGLQEPAPVLAQALQAEGLTVTTLPTDLAADTFTGGLFILAGQPAGPALDETCRKLTPRLESGMTLLLVNPPAGWTRWGLTALPQTPPAASPAGFAKGVLSVLQPADLGQGPWPVGLQHDAHATALAWLDRPRGAGPPWALLACTPVAKGRVVVAHLPQLANPYNDPVGRCILNDILLRILADHASAAKEQRK